MTKFVACKSCSGSGAASAQGVKQCSRCGGTGQVVQSRAFSAWQVHAHNVTVKDG